MERKNNCRTNKCGKCGEYYCRGCFPKGCPFCRYGVEKDSFVKIFKDKHQPFPSPE